MKSLTDFCNGQLEYVTDLDVMLVNEYINHMLGKGLTSRTLNNYLSTFKNFGRYAEENYGVPLGIDKIKKLTEAPAKAKFMELAEYKKVVENADPVAVPWIQFIANTGLRASEFCNLKWKNWNQANKSITFIGKGNKERTVGLNSAAMKVLEDLKPKKVHRNDTIFKRMDGTPLKRRALHHFVAKACENAGFDIKGPHSLRHFFATQLLLRGVPIIKVSKILGHESITTTEKRYAHILAPDFSGVTSCLDGI